MTSTLNEGRSLTEGVADRAGLCAFYGRETWIEGSRGRPACAGGRLTRHDGAVFLADRIRPRLVGPDIGCGMTLRRLDLSRRRLKIDKAARRLRGREEGADRFTRARPWIVRVLRLAPGASRFGAAACDPMGISGIIHIYQ